MLPPHLAGLTIIIIPGITIADVDGLREDCVTLAVAENSAGSEVPALCQSSQRLLRNTGVVVEDETLEGLEMSVAQSTALLEFQAAQV